jgi:flagellar hook-basal body complex protein FliE
MLPLTQAPVSLFGASLDATPAGGSSAVFTGAVPAIVPGSPIVPGSVSGASSIAPAPFADLVTEAVGQVQQLEQQASTAIEGLMSGRGVDVHEAMIATQKASMGFELVLSVRNKALAAYQQVMGMQF